MTWAIEYLNGNIINEDENIYSLNNNHLVSRIYFYDKKDTFGFIYHKGIFFINNCIFDFKIDVNNYNMIPFQHKTANLVLTPNGSTNNLESWNIGYKLVNENETFEYKMCIYYNKEVYFYAKHFVNGVLIKEKTLKLQ